MGRKDLPSMDQWLREAKQDKDAHNVGMYLVHNGVVRESARAAVRQGAKDTAPVKGMYFSYDKEKVDAAIAETYRMDGIYYIRTVTCQSKFRMQD